jgi:hypothetical protein
MTEHPALAQLFGAYFHQDWPAESATARGAVERFAHGEPAAVVRQAAADARALAASERAESDLQALLDAWGSEYHLAADGLTPRAWLTQVAAWLDAAGGAPA